jgi:hypothetical protein
LSPAAKVSLVILKFAGQSAHAHRHSSVGERRALRIPGAAERALAATAALMTDSGIVRTKDTKEQA